MSPPGARDRRVSAIMLALLLPLSLILTATANHVAGRMLRAAAPSLAWLADTALPSCLLIGCLHLAFGDGNVLHWPRPAPGDRQRMIRLSLSWLILWIGGCALYAISVGHWTIYAPGRANIAAFLVFGPLGEELLFRGLIFGLARAVWPGSALPAIALSTAAFSLHHFSLNTAPGDLALAQILFTIPMGIVFAHLRERSFSIWPGVLLHVATNLPATG